MAYLLIIGEGRGENKERTPKASRGAESEMGESPFF
jgi:hypothetical protein